MDIYLSETRLQSALLGEELAEKVSAALEFASSVRVDFSNVTMMTPSYANAFVMTLLERHDLVRVKAACVFDRRSSIVVEAMNAAVRRYLSGIRLSAQRCPSADSQ